MILSGISTLASTSGPNAIASIEGFLDGKTLNTSYILKRIEEENFDPFGSYLTGMLGEEDNSWEKPAK